MSTLTGTETERWSLSRAIDALSESARQAGHPGLVWFAGLVYTLTAGLGFGWDGGLAQSIDIHVAGAKGRLPGGFLHSLGNLPFEFLALFALIPCAGILFLPCFRLTVGLARLGPARAWAAACGDRRTPRLRTVWAAGKGVTLSAFGLWLQLALMVAAAALLASLPVAALAKVIDGPIGEAESAALMGAVLVPLILLLLGYVTILSVLNQFALHSLAHNRRGVYSALLHGWRIMRNDGWATARAVLVDVLLFVTVALAWVVVSGAGKLVGSSGDAIAVTVKIVLTGFAGVARAGYWARAYRSLGGLSADDGVPGL
ncbi:MAG TPA: hypothetical protein VGR31_16960 [Planctomycetota bacterium]|jgi:hypothetical protein|nr:hypothetical protein [Planctomycetota bacterium]